jgi:nucleotide-binding universal stress UspA family protein
MATFKRILVLTDFTSQSELAVGVAADLARQLGAALTLAHVLDPIRYAVFQYEPQPNERRDALFAEVAKNLAALERRVLDAGAISVNTQSLEGGVSTAILEFAQRVGFDLIVMGSHGRTGIKRAVLGSVSETVARSAECPVLIVKGAPS